MIISFWRYCHLTLAISSFLFILVASVTGAILAFEPITDQTQVGQNAQAADADLAQTVAAVKQKYLEVFSISVDENGLVAASVMDENGDFGEFYVNPKTGEKVAELIEKDPVYQFATSLHRSLFLKSIGRFFVGLSSLLLFLIAISGTVLIAKRQQGIRHFFKKIINDNLFQYAHVYLGRWSLIPIIIVTVTGVYLSLLRFDLLPALALQHEVDFENLQEEPGQSVADFEIFKNTALADVRSVEFPFAEDVEEFYKVQLQSKEILVNQFTGAVVSELKFPFSEVAAQWSVALHTGRGNSVWAVILALSCISILFFIYSGFAMTLKRRSGRIKNKFKKDQCKYVILVGSESGSTMKFATLFQQQLLAAGEKAYLTELNRFSRFKKMEHLVVFAATYGSGEAPSNGKKFAANFTKIESEQPYKFSVVGFGSLAYTHFCQFAYDVEKLLLADKNAIQLMKTYTINNRSWEAFNQWVDQWGAKVNVKISVPNENPITRKRKKKHAFTVVQKTEAGTRADQTFTIELKVKVTQQKLKSGDLLAVYPNDETHERLYSVGLTKNGNVLLSVKRHEKGLCSNFLNNLKVGEKIQASVVKNRGFHLPKKATEVIMISTGTGIAPFLGMLNFNSAQSKTHLIWGGQDQAGFALYKNTIDENLASGSLTEFTPAFSRASADKMYVQNVVEQQGKKMAGVLKNKGVIMICGSISMQKEVTAVLQKCCEMYNGKPLSFYQNRGQLKMDCY